MEMAGHPRWSDVLREVNPTFDGSVAYIRLRSNARTDQRNAVCGERFRGQQTMFAPTQPTLYSRGVLRLANATPQSDRHTSVNAARVHLTMAHTAGQTSCTSDRDSLARCSAARSELATLDHVRHSRCTNSMIMRRGVVQSRTQWKRRGVRRTMVVPSYPPKLGTPLPTTNPPFIPG